MVNMGTPRTPALGMRHADLLHGVYLAAPLNAISNGGSGSAGKNKMHGNGLVDQAEHSKQVGANKNGTTGMSRLNQTRTEHVPALRRLRCPETPPV